MSGKKLCFLLTLMMLATSVGGVLTKVTIKGCWSLLGSGFIEFSNIFTPFTIICHECLRSNFEILVCLIYDYIFSLSSYKL
jgi:hypothetical protein